MKQLYVIIVSGGSYDSSWERTEFVTDDESKGNTFVDEMNARAQVLQQYKEEISEWRTNWLKQNPLPIPLECPVVLPIPKWDSKVKVTEEMREERRRIEDANRSAYIDAQQPYMDWMLLTQEEWVKWQQATYPKDVLDDLEKEYDDAYWSIDPVAWLE